VTWVREQEGDEVFAVVETIRQTAVKFRREEDNEASQTLEKRLKSLSPEQTVSVVRAFSYFSHLANIARTGITTGAGGSTRSPVPARSPARWPMPSNA